MTFSGRTAWDRTPSDFATILELARGHGRLLDLTESNPTHAGLATDPDELAGALGDARNVGYAPEPLGLPSAREAVTAWLRAREVEADASRIVLTASTSEAYGMLFKLLCDPGDTVLVPQPSYPLLEDLARLECVELQQYRLRYHRDAWRLDLEALASSLPASARAVVVVQPNNPTGSLLGRDEAVALGRLCRERDLALISDEVFAEFRWSGEAYPSLHGVGIETGALTFSLSGLSKPCGLPQLKLGWIACSGQAPLVNEALARLELIADTTLSVSTPVQHALPALLSMGEHFRDRCRERLARNLAAIDAALAPTRARRLGAEAGWSAVIELPEGRDAWSLARELARDAGVLVQPGELFGVRGERIVVSLLTEPEVLDAGMAEVRSRV